MDVYGGLFGIPHNFTKLHQIHLVIQKFKNKSFIHFFSLSESYICMYIIMLKSNDRTGTCCGDLLEIKKKLIFDISMFIVIPTTLEQRFSDSFPSSVSIL